MQAFRLTDDLQETFSGGSVKCSALGHMLDVGDALDKGNGLIVTDDDIFAEVLRSFPGLVRVPDEDIPNGHLFVDIPGGGSLITNQTGPWQIQTNDVLPTQVGEGEVIVQHRDEASDVEGAVQTGEAVSGLEHPNVPPLDNPKPGDKGKPSGQADTGTSETTTGPGK